MDLDDFMQPEVAVAAVVVAALFSPRTRKFLRRGLVYGTAGVLIAGDTITSFARNIGQGIRQTRASGGGLTQESGKETSQPHAEEAGG
jgi:hypothetical protein